MNSFWIHIIHQAIFGGIASAGFGVLFNCPPRGHFALHRFGGYGLGNSNGMSISQSELTGIRVFCCAGSGHRRAGIAAFSGNPRIDHCAVTG
jgi:hypothetical protein